MPYYTVQQGDCIESIAAAFGLQWEKIWNDPGNTELKQRRQDPNVLLPGDIVFVPELTSRWESCQTDRCHEFVLARSFCKLVLVLKDFDKPRANEPYLLVVDGQSVTGTTDDKGRLEARIQARAVTGRLYVGRQRQEEYLLKLGHIDPITESTGIEARLRNLGYASLSEFQEKRRLPATGEPDAATLARLQDEYGC